MIATAHNTLPNLEYFFHILGMYSVNGQNPQIRQLRLFASLGEVNSSFSPKYNFPKQVVFFSYLRALRSSKFLARFAISSSNVSYRLQIHRTSSNKNRSFAISNSKFDISSLRSLQALKFVIPEFLNRVPFFWQEITLIF
jgi:hypothetical protein